MTFLVRRAATLVATLLVVSVLAFLIPYAGEGDPARKILQARVNDPALDPAQVEALTRELGLDRPLHVQYLEWLGQAAGGDFPTERVRRAIDGRWERRAHGLREMPVWGWQLYDSGAADHAAEQARVAAMIERLIGHLRSVQRP